MMRARTSRAVSSVPSQCVASGGDGAGTGTDQAKVVRGWKETLQNLKSFTSNYYHRNQMKAEDGN